MEKMYVLYFVLAFCFTFGETAFAQAKEDIQLHKNAVGAGWTEAVSIFPEC